MKIYERYFVKEIYLSFIFVSFALCSLLLLLDLLNEFSNLGNPASGIQIAFGSILKTPGHLYETAPVAILISSIYVLTKSATLSEWTIFRLAGLSPSKALYLLMKIGFPLLLLTFLLGEFLVPFSDRLTTELKLHISGNSSNLKLSSGIWLRDKLIDPGSGKEKNCIIHVKDLMNNTTMQNITIYEFTSNLVLTSVINAKNGIFIPPDHWKLKDIRKTSFKRSNEKKVPPKNISIILKSEHILQTNLNPEIISVLTIPPNRMSIRSLMTFIKHLELNKQNHQRYRVAFWRKIFYPVGTLVMVSLSTPFAYLNARSGTVGLKVFAGILIGVSFLLVNTLFSHISTLSSWPVSITLSIPSFLYGLIALIGLRWIDRH